MRLLGVYALVLMETGMEEVGNSMAGLTRLTALSLSVIDPGEGWTFHNLTNRSWRAATFLTGLTRLVHLELKDILHVAHVQRDVSCLAVLSELQSLHVLDSCLGDTHDMGSKAGGCKSGAQSESFKKRGGVTRRFLELEAQGTFLPLVSLTRVRDMYVTGPWKVLQGAAFATQFNAMRRKLGRPPLNFGQRRIFELEYRSASIFC